jgi:hypothetical protein
LSSIGARGGFPFSSIPLYRVPSCGHVKEVEIFRDSVNRRFVGDQLLISRVLRRYYMH